MWSVVFPAGNTLAASEGAKPVLAAPPLVVLIATVGFTLAFVRGPKRWWMALAVIALNLAGLWLVGSVL